MTNANNQTQPTTEDTNRNTLTNIWYGQTMGTIISPNTIQTSIGTYHVTDGDIEWLRKQQSKHTFCERDIKAVGQLIIAE